MITLNLEIPQLPVMEQPSYPHVTIRFATAKDQHFLYAYLSNKMAEFAVSHDILNEQLRKIYISHAERRDLQVEFGMYKLDNHHYAQLLRTSEVSGRTAAMLSELMFCVYFMKNLKNQRHPPEMPLKDAIDWVLQHQELSGALTPHTELVKKCETILGGFQLTMIRPAYDYFLTEEQPVYFITEQNGTLSRHSLRKLIEDYTAFFATVKKLLKTHAPEAIALGITDEPNE